MNEIQKLKVKVITPSPMNPRKRFGKDDIAELAKNIKQQGLLQPITVRPIPPDESVRLHADGTAHDYWYEVVCGERRFRAVEKLGWEEIPAIVRDMTDEEAFYAMITENLQRKDVDPVEEAMAFSELMSKGQSVRELAVKFGKTERYIQDRTKLCSLIPELKKELAYGHLPIAGAIYIAKCDEKVQKEFWEEEIDGRYEKDDGDTCPFYTIKEFVQTAFQKLDYAPWLKDDEDESWNDGKEVPKCKTCECNTANHGCLFYEMKQDGKCTKAECFEKKGLVFRKWKLSQMKLMKKGEEYKPDMTVAIETKPEAWRTDSFKEKKNRANEFMKEAFPDIEIIPVSELSGKCWYKEDDERLQKMLAEGKVFRTVELWSDYGEKGVEYYYKKGIDSDACNRSPEECMEAELEKARLNNRDRMGEELRKRIEELDFGEMKGHEDVVKLAVGLILFSQVAYTDANSLGVGWDGEKWLEYLRGGEENYWNVVKLAFKDFCHHTNSGHSVARVLLMKEFAPEVYDEVEKMFREKLEKMEAKIREKYADK